MSACGTLMRYGRISAAGADAVRRVLRGALVVRHVFDARSHWCQVLAPIGGKIDGMLETSARLLRLLSLLQSRRDWTGTELADRLGVGLRTVRRDIDRLRDLGYPVDATPGVAGGYRLGAGAALPPLLLDDEEAVAVAISLHTATAGSVAGLEETSLRALTKLQQMLPSRLRRTVSALHATTVPLAGRSRRHRGPGRAHRGRGRLPGPAAAAASATPAGTASRPATSSRTAWCTPRAAGTWWPGTPAVTTGGPSALDRIQGPLGPPGARFTPRPPPADDVAAYVSAVHILRALPLPGPDPHPRSRWRPSPRARSPAAGRLEAADAARLHPAHRVQLARRTRSLHRGQGLRLPGAGPARARAGPAHPGRSAPSGRPRHRGSGGPARRCGVNRPAAADLSRVRPERVPEAGR